MGVREFITSEDYLGLEAEVYPGIVDVMEELFEGGYNEAALCWGIGAGKSYAASLAILYLLHRTLCLRDPQDYYGVGVGSTISFLNMAPNGDQARRVVFSEILGKVTNSKWFMEHYEPRVLSRELRFAKNVAVICGNSAETYPLGYNILGAVIDEANWLVESEGGRHDAAEEIYNALQRRIRSRFLDHGLLVMISSPKHRGDFLERKMAEAATDPSIYASRKTSWEMKPPGTYSGETFECRGMQVPVEYRAEFARNEQRALRDLAALPAEAFVPFFPDTTVLERAIDEDMRHPFDAAGRLRADWQPTCEAEYYVHVDLALSKDACGIAMAHCEPSSDREDSPIAVVDLALQLVPPQQGEVDISSVRSLVLQVARRGFNIAQVSFDGYQSADSRQILRRKGLKVRLVSVDRDIEAYETLKGMLNEGRVRWYRYEPLLRECKGLELVHGVKVDHRQGGSKDVADAVAASVNEAVRNWRAGEILGHIV
ncbi:MAG: hypothetical protein J7M38_08180 [Armatimonadetes bacterium]|nr:hypothetical protein [Armatimonadota bacterium]